ncbi:MAG: gamma carbonic anhydrase family protein, partial [Candidatus Eiseniibacteriota bacterium]
MAEPFRLKEELSLDPTAFVAPGASVAGRVTLRARSSVWFSAVIRADMDRAELGEESNLQDGSVVHVDEGFPTIIGRRVTVGHRAIVHGATVEDESLVGMGAILLNGAHIGRGSLIAAGSLVREGQKIPPASLVVGSPARVIGPVRPEHTEAIRRGVDHYVEFAASYRARGYAAAFPAGPAGVVQAAIGRGDEIEWSHALEQLELTPARIAQDLEGLDSSVIVLRPDEDKWSALDVLCHL